MTQNPKEWFDQFIDLPHDVRMDEHTQWCWRHWAPCPTYGANGILATTMVMSAMVSEMPSGLTVGQQNAFLASKGRICCVLGDEKMYEIWGSCGPSREDISRLS